MTVITDPSALAMPSSTPATGTSNLPSSFGC
jgi:hypothetical protein